MKAEGTVIPTVVVLAGGLGTRLKKVVSETPKVLAKINSKPYIEHLLNWCESQKVNHVHFCLGYKAQQVIEWLETFDSNLVVSWQVEAQPRGTGGAICNAINYLSENAQTKELLVCNGDTFVSFQLAKFVSLSRDIGGGMLTTNVANASRYGSVKVTDGLLSSFYEKQQIDFPGVINAGWYYLGEYHLSHLASQSLFSFEKEYLMSSSRPPIRCVNEGVNFLDFGTPESYIRAQELF